MDKREIAKILRDYSWMIREIARQRKIMENDVNQSITGQYGIDGSLPHGKGDTSDPVAIEVIRREKKSKWIAKLERQVSYVQARIHVIENEREKAVLECMLDGMNIRAIARHMGLSDRHIFRLRDSIVDQMADMSHFADKLKDNKSVC
ncbi:DNA-binding response regulator [Sporolactobacillus sp. THM7-7]|nr:DNA-binding response regulator [Sporolactobacillus sp. THM7-7]